MKKTITLSLFLLTFLAFAQVPQGISYQAIALNSSGNPVASSNVNLRLSLLDGSTTGTNLYTETHIKTTNAQGLFNLVIGQGTVVSGVFNTINWGTNSKFLKVEMDATGGTNYVLVGTTQLLSVPYALAADSLVTSPGEGITLVSPNGTPYQVTVNDAGQLSLPTTNSTSPSSPNNFYMYGSFNSFNPTTSLLMGNALYTGYLIRSGYKYLTAGTELKFLANNNVSSPIYGINLTNNLQVNGTSYLVDNTGFYLIRLVNSNNPTYPLNDFNVEAISMTPGIFFPSTSEYLTSTYSVANNKFTFIVNDITTNDNPDFFFSFPNYSFFNGDYAYYGDNLADGNIDEGGSFITFPNLTATPKNFRIELILNFNGSGSYTITQIP